MPNSQPLIRELEIRDALDGIRAEVFAMKTTEDIGPVLGQIYRGANDVGLETTLVSVNIVNEAQDTCQYFFLADADKIEGEPFRHNVYGKLDLYRSENSISETTRQILASKRGIVQHREEDKLSSIWLGDEERHGVKISNAIYPQSSMSVPFSHGTIGFHSTQPDHFSESDLPTAARFAEMLSLGYARFLDFQRLDEQNNALHEANARIQEATRLKSQFLATMSHELRTPMNSIIGFTRIVLRRSENLEDRQRENLEKVQLSADHLLNLINDILDLSKIEAGRIDIEPSTFNIKKLILNCCATVGPTLGKPGVALDHTINDNIEDLHTDEARVRQIVINLLSNALKFTDEGAVTINATQDENALTLAISDTGIGIPQDQLETIFEEFRQVDGSNTRRHEGTGLGLAITKRLVQLLGGTMSVTSVVGKGSTFTFTIPTRYGTPLSTDASVPSQPDASASGRAIIVSIDDDPNIAVLIRQELEDDNYQVISALNADEGIDLVKKHKPVAITLDILMPGKDGWQTISQLKSNPETRDIPIIVVSAIENRSLGFSMGVHDYLVKPFTREDLITALGRILPEGINDVLVVEDEAVANKLLCEMLSLSNIEARTAYNGREALDRIAEQQPDLIFLDLMMPIMDGFEVIQHLQKNDAWKTIPVIVVTAKDLTSEEELFLRNHVSRVVQKGTLEPDALGKTIKEVVEKH